MEEKDPILEYDCEYLLVIGQHLYSLYGDWCLINIQLIIALLQNNITNRIPDYSLT